MGNSEWGEGKDECGRMKDEERARGMRWVYSFFRWVDFCFVFCILGGNGGTVSSKNSTFVWF